MHFLGIGRVISACGLAAFRPKRQLCKQQYGTCVMGAFSNDAVLRLTPAINRVNATLAPEQAFHTVACRDVEETPACETL